jgi:glyoxylase-like metal-dependent hydrolase (beta-lactamase superfamily II)
MQIIAKLVLLIAVVGGSRPAIADEAFPPHRVAGNVYYVGSRDISSYLVTSDDGHAIINSGFEETVPLIRASVESLGFRMRDVKVLLHSHAHSDHVAGHALLQELTGAQVYVMNGDVDVIRSGGKGQYLYTDSRWRPCSVDRVLRDGDTVPIGATTLIARRTAGHTRGCTTWTCQVTEGDRQLDVVVVGSPNVNPGFQLVNNTDYPEIADDYVQGFAILKKLPCDVFLGAHGKYYGLLAKYETRADSKPNPFIDPQGYRDYIVERETAFRTNLAEQRGFTKLQLTDRYYCDGIASGDINSDGHADIVAGPFWYAGPTFEQKHEFYPAEPLPPEPRPSNSMFSFVHDFSGDGRPDILVLGRVHKHAAYWYENPGAEDQLWEKHYAFERVRGESPTMVDVDGNGVPQVICHWDGRWGWIESNPKQPREPWKFTAIGDDEDWPQFYHGEGVGDINGDGRLDVIINDGWFEQPEPDTDKVWNFKRHRFSNDRGGAQMFAYDVDGDGDNDVISSINGHGWGLAWYEQTSGKDGSIDFVEHRFMGDRSEQKKYGVAFSQPHALALADVDGDGLQDIITGKRLWAHGPTGDVEPNADPVVYWFQLQREPNGTVRFVPHLIDDRSGVGVQITAQDVNGDKRVDVLTVSKLGTFVFIGASP